MTLQEFATILGYGMVTFSAILIFLVMFISWVVYPILDMKHRMREGYKARRRG